MPLLEIPDSLQSYASFLNFTASYDSCSIPQHFVQFLGQLLSHFGAGVPCKVNFISPALGFSKMQPLHCNIFHSSVCETVEPFWYWSPLRSSSRLFKDVSL